MKIDTTTPRQYILRLNHPPPDYRLQMPPSPVQKLNKQNDITNKSISDSIKKKIQLRKISQVSSSQHYEPNNFAQSNIMSIDTKQFHIFTPKNSRAYTCIQQLSYTYDYTIKHQKQRKAQQPQTSLKRNNKVTPRYIPLPLSNPFGPPITAQSWCIINGKNGSMLAGFNEKLKSQIASITKIMTCWLSLKFVSLIQLDLDNTYFTVPEAAENIGGTSAQLQTGDKLNLRDLLYGLMLPSGNDAAITLKHNFELDIGINFIDEMNNCAKEFGLKSTQYMNPHGLYHKFNYSSALDIGMLCYQALQNEHFANIVKTKIYFSEIIDKFGNIKEILWENTNKLLDNGFQGVKTGQTKEAGPCVVEYYQVNNNSYIIVLLNCKSNDERWNDTIKLLDWIKQ